MERVKRDKPTYPKLDMTKPIDTAAIAAELEDEDCFSRKWKPDDTLCAMCADNEVCGILYHKRQNTRVRKLEKAEGGYLDSTDFEAVDEDQLLTWLSIEQRTTEEMVERVTKLSKCPDDTTVQYWCRSFIITHKQLKTKGGVVIVRK